MHPADIGIETAILQHLSEIPLFIAADYERGVGRFNNAFTELPSNMGIGATSSPVLAGAAGRLTGIESRSIGINLLFAPVVDVNSNPENPIINIRSYGDVPEEVTRSALAFIAEVERYGVIATVKHFPGHGGTDVDSHQGLPSIGEESNLLEEGLRPFIATLSGDRSPGAVMTGHIAVPLMDETGVPATLSPPMVRYLRGDIGYSGLIVTDDLRMGAVVNNYSLRERLLYALKAGNDILLTPEATEDAIEILVAAIENGELDEGIVQIAVTRVIGTKMRRCIEGRGYRRHIASIEKFEPGRPVAKYLAQRAITANHDQPEVPRSISRVAHFANYSGSQTVASAMASFDRLVQNEDTSAGDLLVVLYARLREGSGSAGFDKRTLADIRKLLSSNRDHLIVVLGNPYLASHFSGSDILVGYDQSSSTVAAVIDIIEGRQQATGVLPVRLSGR
jgi:beta-N-acetylhexosaminidase